MSNKLNILFWLSAVVLIAGFQNIMSQTEVKLKNHYNVKVCSSDKDKEFLVTLGIGQVLNSDKLYGFDFIVKYDRSKVRIDGPIYLNTISESTKYRDVNIGYDSNMVRAFAFSENPLSGDRELIGFSGVILTDCEEPIDFEIIDFEIADDYTKSFSVESTLTVVPYKVNDTEKKVEINLDRHEIMFETNNTNELIVSVKINPYTDLENIVFDVSLNDDLPFEIIDAVSVNEDVVVDTFVKKDKNLYELNLNLFDNISDLQIIKFIIKEKYKSKTDISGNILISPRDFGNCNCYSEFKGAEALLVSKADSISTVDVIGNTVNKFDLYFSNGDLILHNSDNVFVRNIEIYDVLGNIVKNYNINNSNTTITQRLDFMNSGAYFFKVSTDVKNVNKSIIIYN